jgi:hypothetical protein
VRVGIGYPKEERHSASYRTRHLERNAELGISFHVLQENFLSTTIVELGGPAISVASDALGGFQNAVIFQKMRDTGGSECE